MGLIVSSNECCRSTRNHLTNIQLRFLLLVVVRDIEKEFEAEEQDEKVDDRACPVHETVKLVNDLERAHTELLKRIQAERQK